jgi:uncharacterized repeat protein (TIGR01451 family)
MVKSRRAVIPIAAVLFGFLAWAVPTLAGEVVVNGGFEDGDFGSAWVHGAYQGGNNNPNNADHIVVLDLPYSGNYSALLGFKYTPQLRDWHAYMYQDVVIPANISRATLNFKIRMQGYDSEYYDPFIADIRDTGGGLLERIISFSFTEWNDRFKDSGWIHDDDQAPAGYDVSGYAGQAIRLYFDQANLYDALYETWTYVDDVSLVYWKFVDLIAGGNGGDVFGDPGTGAGGYAIESGVAGDTLRYALEIENEGADNDTYRLTASAPGGWTVLIDDGSGTQPLPYTTPPMTPGTTGLVTVLVVVPTGAPGGSYDVIVDAASTTQVDRFDSVRLRGDIVDDVYVTDLTVDGNGYGVIGDGGAGGYALKQAPWDSVITYDLEVWNGGNQSTAFDISWVSPPGASVAVWYGGTRYTAPFTTAPVAGGATATVTLEVAVPSPEPGGDYETIVLAEAVADSNRRDSIRAALRLSAPRVDLVIATSGDGVYDDTFSGQGGVSSNVGEQGVVVSFPVVLQNESSLPDSFTFDWVPPAGGWGATIEIDGSDVSFPAATTVVPPFSEKNYVLEVTIAAAAAYGTYPSLLNVVSNTDSRISESVTATISVSSPSEIDLVIDGIGADVYGPIGTGLGGTSLLTVNPGDTAVFTVTIENIEGTNAFEVFWDSPPGWQVTFDDQASPITGIAAGTYQLQAVVPATSLGGSFDVIVDSRKVDKPFFMDSVTGRVVVVPPAVVDGLIDGDGAGVFGALGTGQGGSSSQTSPPPASMNYTVELKNLGSQADSYSVTWNTIPLWSATFDASPSPFVTGPIVAGGSATYTFSVQMPNGALTGNYSYIIDVVSVTDSSSFESLEAEVSVVGPPQVDLVIDGDGAGVIGPLGSGQGGSSIRWADAGSSYTASLRVRNVGSFADSFRVDWTPPVGWPAGSVTINDGSSDHAAPFWTAVVPAGGFLDYTVTVNVPAGAGTSDAVTIINSWSSLPPNVPESVRLVTATTALVRGVVFDDRNHDGVFSAGDVPLAGVRVTVETGGPQGEALTGGDGSFALTVAGGSTITVVEHNPSGFISLSPDTLGPFNVVAGDSVIAAFADVPPLYLSPGAVGQGLAGTFVDFPHAIEAGTAGHVDLLAVNDAGAITMFMLDENGNGIFDGNDRALQPGDTDLDPSAPGGGTVAVLMRVFVPYAVQPGATIRVSVTATQTITGTSRIAVATATDAVLVVGSSAGRLNLSKQADKTGAFPGELITYSVRFVNAGADSLQNLVLLDPVSPFVDPVADAFGPGQDVEWQPLAGPPVYLTLDDTDGDECDWSGAQRILRLVPSRNSPFYLAPGESGAFTYVVRVR